MAAKTRPEDQSHFPGPTGQFGVEKHDPSISTTCGLDKGCASENDKQTGPAG